MSFHIDTKLVQKLISAQFADKLHANIDEKGWGFFAAHLIDTEQFIGLIGIEHVNFSAPFTPAVEIGWRLSFRSLGQRICH